MLPIPTPHLALFFTEWARGPSWARQCHTQLLLSCVPHQELLSQKDPREIHKHTHSTWNITPVSVGTWSRMFPLSFTHSLRIYCMSCTGQDPSLQPDLCHLIGSVEGCHREMSEALYNLDNHFTLPGPAWTCLKQPSFYKYSQESPTPNHCCSCVWDVMIRLQLSLTRLFLTSAATNTIS